METFYSSEMTIRCLSELYQGFLFCPASMKKGDAACVPVIIMFDYGVEAV